MNHELFLKAYMSKRLHILLVARGFLFHNGESVPGEIAPVFFASIAVVAHGAMCDKQQRVGLRQAKIPFVQIFESSSSAIS